MNRMILFLSSLFLVSCSSFLEQMDKNTESGIENFPQFLAVYISVQLSVVLFVFILGFFIKESAPIVSVLLHWGWLVWFRDYGFFMVLLLMILCVVVPYILVSVFKNIKDNR